MRKRSKTALGCLFALLIACSDGNIGAEPCVGDVTECGAPPGFAPEQLMIDFVEVSTLEPLPLTFEWTIPNPCGATCPAPQLFSAWNDSVWNTKRELSQPGLELIGESGQRAPQTIVAPPGTTQLNRAYMTPQPDGTVLAHWQWDAVGNNGPDELAILSPNTPPQRIQLAAEPPTRSPAAAIRTPAGFLLFNDGVERNGEFPSSVVRHIGLDGAPLWHQGSFPPPAARVEGAAVVTFQNYVLSAHDGVRGAPRYGLLWLTLEGALQRMSVAGDSSWRSLSIQAVSDSEFVMAAASDLETLTMLGTELGNIDVVQFVSGKVGRAYRIRRDCFYELTMNGLTVDPAGTYFVSSVVGIRNQPRGLLCRLPLSGRPQCYQTEPMRALRAIVATAPDTLFAALDDTRDGGTDHAIVRIELGAQSSAVSGAMPIATRRLR